MAGDDDQWDWTDKPLPGDAPVPAAAPSATANDQWDWSDKPLQGDATAKKDTNLPKTNLGQAVEYGVAHALPFANDVGAAIQAGETYLPKSLQADDTGATDPNASFGQRFQNQKRKIEGISAANEQEYPGTSFWTPLATAAATLPFSGPAEAMGSVAGRFVPGLSSTASDIAGSALVGAGYGGLYGAGEGNTLGDRAKNAALGSGLGLAGGVAGPVIARGIDSGVGSLVDWTKGILNPEASGRAAAVKTIADSAASGNGAMAPAAARTAQQAGQPIVAGDLGGAETQRLARLAANKSPEAQSTLNAPLSERFTDQNIRLSDFIDGMFGGKVDPAVMKSEIDMEKSISVDPAYKQARADGANGVWNPGAPINSPGGSYVPDLAQLAASPPVQEAIRGATKTAAIDAVNKGFPVVKNPFVEDANGNMVLSTGKNGTQAIPTLDFWDVVKRNLDDQIGTAMRGGQKSAAAGLIQTKNNLVSNLDALVPSYAKARAAASNTLGASDQLEAGQKILLQNVTPAQVTKAVSGMTPLQQKAFAYGTANAIAQKAVNSGDNRNIVNMFNTPAIRQKMAAAMGQTRSDQLEAYLRAEGAMNALRNAVQGNSTTAKQVSDLVGAAKEHLPTALGGAGAGVYEAYRENGFDPELMLKYGAAGFLSGAALKTGMRASTALNQKYMQGVAGTIASDSPETFNAIAAKIASNKSALTKLRAVSNRIAALPGAVSARFLPPSGGTQQSPSGQLAPAYAKGGAVKSKKTTEELVDRLFKLAEKAKREMKAETKPILKVHDDAVAHALAVAKRAI